MLIDITPFVIKKCVALFLLSVVLFGFFCVVHLYLQQESKLFQKVALAEDHTFAYEEPFKEIFFDIDVNVRLHALHFYVDQPKGVVLYFHGRGKNLNYNIGKLSHEFVDRGYDFFAIDYRGFGKSRGKLSEKMMYYDADYCYRHLLNYFAERQIIVYGCSLGTGIATYVASQHNPRALILEAPYFSVLDLAFQEFSYLPRFLVSKLLKYHFRTDQWIVKVDSPIHIFHGTDDETIPYASSIRLLELLKEKRNASLVSIEHGKHKYLRYHPKYQQKMDRILN